jgi:2-oxoglutarate ferredoxin oxidoreductase subunit alpha
MMRLTHKFNTAKTLVPAPEFGQEGQNSTIGLIHFGTTAISVPEAMDILGERQIHLDTMRLRAFPFSQKVEDFIASHDKVFVVEQNRDGQMRSLLVNEIGIDPARLVPILNFDGFPITARTMANMISEHLGQGEQEQSQGGFAAE